MVVRYRNAVLFGLAAILIGGVYVATKIGLSYLPPVFFASLRFGFAAVPLLIYVRITTPQWQPRTRDDWYTILASGGLVVAAANVFLFVGQQFTTSATAAVIASLSPVLTVGFAVVFLSNIVSVVNSESLGFRVIGHQQPIRSPRSEEFSKLTADLIPLSLRDVFSALDVDSSVQSSSLNLISGACLRPI